MIPKNALGLIGMGIWDGNAIAAWNVELIDAFVWNAVAC